jgi:N-acetylglucosamine-6-sulfatase
MAHTFARLLRGAVAFGLLASACDGEAPDRPPVADGPNLVLIVTDDQWADTLDVMPNVRNLLGDHGVTFTNAFATTPVCCPSRASLLTGQYARHHGVLDNEPPDGGVQSFRDTETLAVWLQEAGYRTSLSGKYLNGYERFERGYVPPGWDDWHVFAGGSEEFLGYWLNENGIERRYGTAPGDYFTDVVADRAISFIEEKDERPFFVYLAPVAPHFPSIPAPQDEGRFAGRAPARPPSFNEPDASDKPWAGDHPRLEADAVAQADRLRRIALETLPAVDRAVGRVVEAVEEAGELENTAVVFTSDNGYLWGEHRLLGKVWPYEESVRVPLVMRLPGGEEGLREDRLVRNVDIPITLLDLAGVASGLRPDGRSLVPILRGAPMEWRQEVLLEYLGHLHGGFLPRGFTAIRTDRYKYIEWDDGTVELYDLSADPFEEDNVAGLPRLGNLQEELAHRLDALRG